MALSFISYVRPIRATLYLGVSVYPEKESRVSHSTYKEIIIVNEIIATMLGGIQIYYSENLDKWWLLLMYISHSQIHILIKSALT